jgi:hypothetical protein
MIKPIYPFLFSISFALFLLANNIEEINNLGAYDMVLPPILAFLVFAIAIFWIIKFIVKDILRAGVISSLIILFIFYYGVAYDVVKGWNIWGILLGRHIFLLPFWIIIVLIGIFWTIKTRRDLASFTKILNFFTVLLVLISLVNIILYYFNRPEIDFLSDKKDSISISEVDGRLPDIYYILPDMYAGVSALKEHFNFDNKEFIEFLESKDFVVPDQSRSNYRITYFSLASTLNMDYLDYFSNLEKSDYGDFSEILQIIRDNKVVKFLKENGYKIVRFRMDHPIDGADIEVGRPVLSEYNYLLLDSTILRAFGSRRNIFHTYFNWRMRTNIVKSFEELENIPDLYPDDPKFVFFHVAPPHWPYFFASDGSAVAFKFTDYEKIDPAQEREYYLDQLKFINKKIEEVVEAILAKSEEPPIIIIQSDHGYNSPLDSGEIDPIVSVKNFSALHLPGKDKGVVPQTLSPVNTFRLIFDQYFGTKLGQFKNKSYIYNYDQPYEFEEIKPYEIRF